MDLQVKKPSNHFLSIDELVDRTTYSKVAYVKEIDYSNSSLAGVFVRVMLMDCKNRVLVGRIFNVDASELETIVNQLKNKLVRIDFEFNIYRGKKSAVIQNIEVISEDVIEVSEFIDKIDNYKEEMTKLMNTVESIKEPQYRYILNALSSNLVLVCKDIVSGIASTKIGGKVLLINKVNDVIDIMLPESYRNRAKIILLTSLALRVKEEGLVISKIGNSQQLFQFCNLIDEKLLSAEIINFHFSRLEIEEPSTILVKQVLTLYNTVLTNLKLNSIREESPLGGYKYVEEVPLDNFKSYYNF